MAWLEPVVLRGAHARLEPLSQNHRDGLAEAVQDGELWKLWYTSVPSAEGMRKEIDAGSACRPRARCCHGRFSMPTAESPA